VKNVLVHYGGDGGTRRVPCEGELVAGGARPSPPPPTLVIGSSPRCRRRAGG